MKPRAPSKETLLERSVKRVSENEAFCASALRVWSGDEIDVAAVMAFLDCERTAVVRLALCRLPVASAANFRQDVAKIAARAGVEESKLLALFREAASITAFRTADGGQILAAARDDRKPKNGDSS